MDTAFLTRQGTGLIQNKHVSIPIAATLVVGTLSYIGSIWFPSHAAQFKETADAIEKAAMMYATMAASQTGPQQPPNTQPPKQ